MSSPPPTYVPTETQSIYDQIVADNTSPYTVYFRQLFMTYPFLLFLCFLIYYCVHSNSLFDEVRVYFSSSDDDDNETNNNNTESTTTTTTQSTTTKQSINFQSLVKLCPSMTNNLLGSNIASNLTSQFLQLFPNDPIKQQLITRAHHSLHNKPWSFNTILFGPNSFDQTTCCLYRYPMFFGWSGLAQSLLSRHIKGSLFNHLFNNLNLRNLQQKFAQNWKSEQIVLDIGGKKYYFTVLEKRTKSSSGTRKEQSDSDQEISFFLVPDIDGCLGRNIPYINNFVNYICGESNPLKLANSTKNSFRRVIIYNREGRDSNIFKIENSSNFEILGNSNDLSECLSKLNEKLQLKRNSKLFGIGWGFGANLLLKTLSINRKLTSELFIGAISISNPFDIGKCFKNFNKNSWLYKHLLNSLKRIVEENFNSFQQESSKKDDSNDSDDDSDNDGKEHQSVSIDLNSVLNAPNLLTFDQEFTMKLNQNSQNQQQTLEEYYEKQSSCNILDEIEIPLLAIHASDDPFCLPSVFNSTVMPACLYGDNILLVKTMKGGNRGFFSSGYGLFLNSVSFDERVMFDFIEILPKLKK